MNIRLYPFALPLIVALAACRPGAAEYTAAEAPNQLTVNSAATEISVGFLPGSDRLAYGEAQRLYRMAMNGAIRPSDRITISAAGWPVLARRRAQAISRQLSHYGIVASAAPLADVPPDRAFVEIGRYVVTLPRCPDWAKPPSGDFTNATSSNFGCATATNLGLMVASPADLASGQPLGPTTAGRPAAAAVDRYLADQVQLPAASTGVAVALPTGPGAGGGGASTGASGNGGLE